MIQTVPISAGQEELVKTSGEIQVFKRDNLCRVVDSEVAFRRVCYRVVRSGVEHVRIFTTKAPGGGWMVDAVGRDCYHAMVLAAPCLGLSEDEALTFAWRATMWHVRHIEDK